ncbi:MAG: roadblock/LC7 domain-containing protein, partial [Candidatus Hodarchaeota archaeon]
KEGVVVASVSRETEMDSKVLATVSAALVWAGATALSSIGQSRPRTLVHTTKIERVLTVLQPNYQLVLVITKANEKGLKLKAILPTIQSLATRMELVMSSAGAFGKQTTLGLLVEQIPEITQALLLTEEGLPLGSVGFDNAIELAGLASSIFSNGLTFSEHTEYITFSAENLELLVTRVDNARLLMVVCRGDDPTELAIKVRETLATIS